MESSEPVEALLIIDMQVDYFEAPGLAVHQEDLARTCSELARRAHQASCPVIEIRTVHAADGSTWTLDMREDEAGVVIEGTRGVQPVVGLDLGRRDIVTKTRDSAFFGTELDEMLRSMRYIALAGVSTESCIMATAIDAYATTCASHWSTTRSHRPMKSFTEQR